MIQIMHIKNKTIINLTKFYTMKKVYFIVMLLSIFVLGNAQVDTISTNIYQKNGNLGIGTNNPLSKFELVANQTVFTPDFGILSIKNNHYATFDAFSASDDASVASLINGRRSRGTLSLPQNVQAGDRITGIISSMYYNNEFRFNSSIEFYAGEDLGQNSYPSYIVFRTTNKNETERTERMRLTENGNLGIGVTQPETKLRIEGDVSDGNNRSFIRLRNTNTGNKSSVSIAVESNDKQNGAAFGYTSNSFTAIPDFNNMGVISCNGNGFSIYSTTDYGSLRFYTNRDQNGIIERMRINAEGNIGIGTKEPTSKLEIADGDIYISDIDKGIIMKSPDGQCWRGTLDNNGSLKFSQISCPEINVQTSSPENVTTSAKISIFPNPTENSITIKNENNVKKLSYRMLSMNGQLLKSGNVRSNNMSVDISSFSAGMYIINILDKSGNKLVSEKLVKK